MKEVSMIKITIEVAEHSLTRHYKLYEGQLPDAMQENLQNMVDIILETEKLKGSLRNKNDHTLKQND